MLYDWVRGGSEGGSGVTVYLDEVFLVNAAVNGLLLETSVRLTGGARSPGRLIGAAALGGVYAAAVWLPGLAGLASIPGQLAAWAGLCAICFGWRGAAWKSWLWFFGVCCGFAGLVLAAASLLRVPAVSGGGRVWYRVSGRLLIGCAVGLWGLCRLCLERFARHRGPELVSVRLELGGRAAVCTALRDNGNTLRDPFPATENRSDIVENIEQHCNCRYRHLLTPFRWSEDFAHYLQIFPGAMFGIGSGEKQPELHHPDYNFPDALIEPAAHILINLIKLKIEN